MSTRSEKNSPACCKESPPAADGGSREREKEEDRESDDGKNEEGEGTDDEDELDLKSLNLARVLALFPHKRDEQAIRLLTKRFRRYPNFLSSLTKEAAGNRIKLFNKLQQDIVLQPHFERIKLFNLLLVHALQPCAEGLEAYKGVEKNHKPRHPTQSRIKIWLLLIIASAMGCISPDLREGWVHILWDMQQTNLFLKNCMFANETNRSARVPSRPYYRVILDNFLSDRCSKQGCKPSSVHETALPTKLWKCPDNGKSYLWWELRTADHAADNTHAADHVQAADEAQAADHTQTANEASQMSGV